MNWSSWRTFALGALSLFAVVVPELIQFITANPAASKTNLILGVLGVLASQIVRDNKRSSEDAGIKPPDSFRNHPSGQGAALSNPEESGNGN